MEDVYQRNGYENRSDYLCQLADDNGADAAAVFALADVLGPGEDFDGLVTSIEDFFR